MPLTVLVTGCAAQPSAGDNVDSSNDALTQNLKAGRYRWVADPDAYAEVAPDYLVEQDFVVERGTDGKTSVLLEPIMYASSCRGGDQAAAWSCAADYGSCRQLGNGSAPTAASVHVDGVTAFDFYPPYPPHGGYVGPGPRRHFVRVGDSPARCPAIVDPFEPATCAGPALTAAQAASFFKPGTAWMSLGQAAESYRSRACNAVTGCGEWGPSASGALWNAELSVRPGGIFLSFAGWECGKVDGSLRCTNIDAEWTGLRGTAVLTDHCAQLVLSAAPQGSSDPAQQVSFAVRF